MGGLVQQKIHYELYGYSLGLYWVLTNIYQDTIVRVGLSVKELSSQKQIRGMYLEELRSYDHSKKKWKKELRYYIFKFKELG